MIEAQSIRKVLSPNKQRVNQKLQQKELLNEWYYKSFNNYKPRTLVGDTVFNEQVRTPKKKISRRWRKLYNVYHSLRLFQTPQTKHIQNFNDLNLSLINDPIMSQDRVDTIQDNKMENTHHVHLVAQEQAIQDINVAIYEFKYRKQFFEHIENGKEEDLGKMKAYIDNDPKMYLYPKEHPYRRINQINELGETPLYVACRNGHLNLVKWLLDNGANPNQEIKKHNCEDTILAVALRWKHYKVVNHLLSNVTMSQQILTSGLSQCENGQYISRIKALICNK